MSLGFVVEFYYCWVRLVSLVGLRKFYSRILGLVNIRW